MKLPPGSTGVESIEYDSPVEATMDVIGGKWKPLILYYLMQKTMRFNELRRAMPGGVTQRMLTKHLRELESAGVVHREVYAEVPPKVEYSLTELGYSLRPVLEAMLVWGLHYAQVNEAVTLRFMQKPPTE
ncbi:MAG: helix-turn-helix transcriptional regulator [Anaerolineae bacterium]|nr:helix-turn-helix transcriptional regulator [Anaerolineae bacterium]